MSEREGGKGRGRGRGRERGEGEGEGEGRERETERIITIDHLMYIISTCSRERVERMVSLPTPYRLPHPPSKIPAPLLEHPLKLTIDEH